MSKFIDKIKVILEEDGENLDKKQNRLRVYYGNVNTILTKAIALVVCGTILGVTAEKSIQQKQKEKEKSIKNSIYDDSYLDYELKNPYLAEAMFEWMNLEYKDSFAIKESIITYDIKELSSLDADKPFLKVLNLTIDIEKVKEEDKERFMECLNDDLNTLCTFFDIYELKLKHIDLKDLEEKTIEKMHPYRLILESCKNDFCDTFLKNEVKDLSIYNHQTTFDLSSYYSVEDLYICASKVEHLDVLFELSRLNIASSNQYNNNYTKEEVQQYIDLYNKKTSYDKAKWLGLFDTDANDITFPNNINVSLDYFEGVEKEQHVKADSLNRLFILDCSNKEINLYIDANYIGDFYHEGSACFRSLNIKNKNAQYGFNGGTVYMEKSEFEQLDLWTASMKLIDKEKIYDVEYSTLSNHQLEITERAEKIKVKD